MMWTRKLVSVDNGMGEQLLKTKAKATQNITMCVLMLTAPKSPVADSSTAVA